MNKAYYHGFLARSSIDYSKTYIEIDYACNGCPVEDILIQHLFFSLDILIQHLSFSCAHVKFLWHAVYVVFGISQPSSMDDLLLLTTASAIC